MKEGWLPSMNIFRMVGHRRSLQQFICVKFMKQILGMNNFNGGTRSVTTGDTLTPLI
jgi:hypothetical protein